jgi:hypothetical protein
VLGDPVPPAVRTPLRAYLRQAFLAGARDAPLVDALADVAGWSGEPWPTSVAGAGSVEVVIPVRGAHASLRLCLAALAASATRKADATIACAQAEYEAVTDIICEPRESAHNALAISRVASPEPQSFAANVNLAASTGRSEFLVLLNSDAFVGPEFLEKILAPFADPEVVAVGPVGTNVSGHQQATISDAVGGRGPTTRESIRGYHTAWAAERAALVPSPAYAARRLVGFCVAVRRSAWNRIGGMDERFANAYCDDDLSLRLSLVGKCVVVPNLLVLHEGQASFLELPNPANAYDRALQENRARFAEKWRWLWPDWNEALTREGWR